jgi:hypothetical protein
VLLAFWVDEGEREQKEGGILALTFSLSHSLFHRPLTTSQFYEFSTENIKRRMKKEKAMGLMSKGWKYFNDKYCF